MKPKLVPIHLANVINHGGKFSVIEKTLEGNRAILVGFQEDAPDPKNPVICIKIVSPSLTEGEFSELKFSLNYDAATTLFAGLIKVINRIESQKP